MPSEMAQQLPGKQLHVRALCNGLNNVRLSLSYVKNMLENRDTPWYLVQDTVARELTIASMFLGGILDGCIIVANLTDSQGEKKQNIQYWSFKNTPFHDKTLRQSQERINALRSHLKSDQAVTASFWSVVNFWKHYLPYQPLPSEFTRQGSVSSTIHDFKLELGSDSQSGPVVHDLLIPAFNEACVITSTLLDLYSVPEPDTHRVEQIPL